MSLDFRTLISFYAEFERQIAQDAQPGLFETFPRNTSHKNGLTKLFSGYSNCEIEVFELDFTEGLGPAIDLANASNESVSNYITAAELGSFVLNFDTRAEIYVNDADNHRVGVKVLNPCHRRFLLLKEVYHVVLRDEFMRHKVAHPDTSSPELLVSLLEELIFLPFSIIDFDNPDYSDAIKVEHAAELFAALSMYPLDHVAVDRKEFLEKIGKSSMTDTLAQISSTLLYAEKYKLPRRYVDLLFRWKRFDEMHALYRQYRKGY